MAGKIIADQIEHSTAGSLDTQYVVNGSAKAWINFNGQGTPAARDSFNYSSLTDNSTGNYTFGIANDMSNANYAASTIIHPATSVSPAMHTCEADCSSGYLAGSLRVECAYSTTSTSRTEFDPITATVVINGDLA